METVNLSSPIVRQVSLASAVAMSQQRSTTLCQSVTANSYIKKTIAASSATTPSVTIDSPIELETP